jgi:hypothetical protein
MKKIPYISILCLLVAFNLKAQETSTTQESNSNYIEFNDSKNIVHGVYLGLTFYYGEIDGKSTYLGGAKIAYVANQKFEVGVAGVGFYSDQNSNGPLENNDVFGGYGGLHLEPIFFGNSSFSLSIPMLIGGGAVGHSNENWDDVIDGNEIYVEDWDPFFVFEPGVSLQYNISSYLQFEMGVKYRLTSDVDLYPGSIENVNGFSGGLGIKIGVFNLGKKG